MGIVALTLACACPEGEHDRGSPPPMLGSHGNGTAEDASSSDTAEATSTGAEGETLGSGGASKGSSGSDAAADTTAADVCAPEPTDSACFACGKELCCAAYEMCRADPQCDCAIDCIDAGGMATPCNEMCGQSDASNVLLVCAYVNCESECQGI